VIQKQNLIRRDKIGFVYQSNNLFSDFTAIENVTIPQILLGASKKMLMSQLLNV
jgi:ABC-type lipoprotein export system ATPase subunit